MKSTDRVYQQKNNQIDIPSIVRALTRNWWGILMCGLILGMWTYMAVSTFGRLEYTSSVTLIISNNGNNNSVFTETALGKISGQYQKVLTSSVLQNKIREEMGWEKLPGTLTASVVTDTNLLVLEGVAEKPGDAYLLVRAAMDNYSQVSDYLLSNFVLEEMSAPVISTLPSNRMQAISLAIKAVLLGIAGAMLIIGMFTFLRDDIKNETQVDSLLDIPLFASVYYEDKKGRSKGKFSNKTEGILITSPVTSLSYTENIKKMASKVDYKAKKNQAKIILVTSVLENEGKSTIAANLALGLMEKSKKVLLLDGDLRKPSLYKLFEKEIAPKAEIGKYLEGETAASDCLKKDKDTGMYYMFGTKSYRNSDILLSSSRMKSILKQAKSVVDYIIIDSAPTSITSDAEVIAERADGVLLVVRQCASRAADINDTADVFKKSHAELFGCVFNAVKTRVISNKKSGYDYGYGYGNKYGKYYKKSSERNSEGGQ